MVGASAPKHTSPSKSATVRMLCRSVRNCIFVKLNPIGTQYYRNVNNKVMFMSIFCVFCIINVYMIKLVKLIGKLHM